MTRVSVLVPFRENDGERQRHWSWLRARWERLHPEWDLVVADGGGQSFSRAAAINAAARRAPGDTFVIFDADVALRSEVMRAAAVECAARESGILRPWRVRNSLSREATAAWIACDVSCDPPVVDVIARGGGSSEIVVSRRAFEAVNGFDERFGGWGYEDTAFAAAVDALVAPTREWDTTLWHLWHRPPPNDAVSANLSLYGEYLAVLGEPEAMRHVIEHRPGLL